MQKCAEECDQLNVYELRLQLLKVKAQMNKDKELGTRVYKLKAERGKIQTRVTTVARDFCESYLAQISQCKATVVGPTGATATGIVPIMVRPSS